ncbi:MAG: hypothetical protein JKY81_07930 [Colwellia sp.]|nr:hypothetical protein [Colwellia sp.]
MKFFKFSLFILLYSITIHAFAKGPSPYLPLQVEPLIELELNRLATLAKLPILTKPYHAATVNRYLEKIIDSYPALYQRISTYLKRYKKATALTYASVQLNYADTENITLPNQRGQMADANYQVSFSSFWQANQYLIFNAGGRYYDGGDYLRTNTFISFGADVLQVDIGYRERWISPFQEGAVLLSTQAKAPLSVTISNPRLITDYNIKYEMSIGLLDEQNDIRFDRNKAAVSGKPALLTMHLSAQPFDWWTLGFNRTLMFGGDEKVTLSDVWNAIIDPVNNDNCGGIGTALQNCSEEFGNQQASITSKFDLNWFNMPFSFYYEYAGEDTNNYTNYKLANLANSFGLFFPYLNEAMSLNMEFTTFQSAWYTHHIYGEGYSNGGVKMGHWWGSMKDPKDGVGGEAGSVRFDWQNSDISQISLLYRTANFNNSLFADYQQAHEVELKYTRVVESGFLGIKLYLGKNNESENFVQTSVSYTW